MDSIVQGISRNQVSVKLSIITIYLLSKVLILMCVRLRASLDKSFSLCHVQLACSLFVLILFFRSLSVLQNHTEPISFGASKGSQPRKEMHLGEAFHHKSQLQYRACPGRVCRHSQPHAETEKER